MKSRSPDTILLVLLPLMLLASPSRLAFANVELVVVDVPQKEVWVGQKATFHVELRGKGPFVGAASFSIPQVAQTVIVKVGNPTVSSEDLEDDSWFVQTHEFALFSQLDGAVEIPSFQVRFSNRDGFTGPVKDHVEQVPALQFQIQRPADSNNLGFLVTTEEIDVRETWDPQPSSGKLGDVFHRTITQSAENVAGMALEPPPTDVPKGIRVYPDTPKVSDNTERGEFKGTRSDTITYLLEQPGKLTIPAIKYVWWNPDSQSFGSKTLPAVRFDIAAPPPSLNSSRVPSPSSPWYVYLIGAIALLGLVAWQRHHFVYLVRRIHRWWNPPDCVAARMLIRACHRNDVKAAEYAWNAWRGLQESDFQITPRLEAATTDLYRHTYGPVGTATWNGAELQVAFRDQVSGRNSKRWMQRTPLPELNPR